MIATAPQLTVRELGAGDGAAWDALVGGFANHRVTHLSPWIASLETAGCGTPLYLVIEKHGAVVGALPGLLSQAGPFTTFGSPRAGWQTVSLGPVFDPARVTTAELMSAVVPHLEREHNVSHIELMHTALDGAAMRAAGFTGQPVFTYRAPLVAGDAGATFKRLKDSARRNVNRARRLGIEVRDAVDESFVDEHYDQLIEVYRNNGAAIPFSRRRLLACYRHLKDSGQLIAVQAFLPGGRVCIATGTFLVANGELNLWMWAHRNQWRWYRATELMTWTVIERALALGCTSLDFMGAGEFKTRLGAEPDNTKWRWMRSRPRWLLPARAVAGAVFHAQQAVRGSARRGAADLTERVARLRRGPRAAAVVFGDADLVRALHLAGIGTTLLAPPGGPAAYSRATSVVLPWIDPGLQPDAALDQLIRHGQAQAEPPALFYQDDQSLLFVSRHREALRTAFRFVVPDAALVEALVDKNMFQALARKLRLAVPASQMVDPSQEAPPAAGVTFPVVVKPLRRTGAWNAISQGHKALRVESFAMLGQLWPTLAALGAPVLIQTLVDGPETAIESYHVYVDDKGATVAEFTGKKIRTWPVDCGDSSALTISDAPDVTQAGRDAIKRLKLRGVAKLDFKRAPDGALYLLEVNPRFTLWHHLAARAGCNIPALVYGDLLALPRPAVTPARVGANWCKVWTDHSAARADGVPLHRWLAWALHCDALSAFAWTDPMPLLGAAARKLRGRLWPAAGPDTSVRLAATTVA